LGVTSERRKRRSEDRSVRGKLWERKKGEAEVAGREEAARGGKG